MKDEWKTGFRFILHPSFPRSAWERRPGRSASRPWVGLVASARKTTRSVEDGVPTQSVGTRKQEWKTGFRFILHPFAFILLT